MGKNAPTARSYHLADGPKLDYFRERFDQHTRERYDALAKTSRDIFGKRLAKNAMDDKFADEIRELELELGRTIFNIERSGQQPSKEVRTPDGKGGEDVERIPLPVVANLEKKIASLKAEREKLASEKLPTDEFDQVNEALSGLPHSIEFVLADLPSVADLKPGETLLDVYAHERATLDMFGEVIERTWAAPRTTSEMKARMRAVIDSQVKVPELGGIRRGNSTDHRGNPRVATPMATLGWPRQSHGFWLTPSGGKLLETQNALPTLLWLFGDEIKAKLDSVIDEKYSDDDAISAADKPAMIAKAEADLWNQRRVVEETYLAATAAGFKIKRPRDTPIEILLGLEKFGTKPAIEPEPVIAPKVADEKPAVTTKPLQPKAKRPADADTEAEFG